MTSSPARVEANRKNAGRSTGPKTPEGKDASRRNALKHGLTGEGIVVPSDDLARIAAVATDLHAEYRPTTTVGIAMIDRAAMLLVRLNRSGHHELALVADQVRAAVYDFDQARRDWADELFDGLAANPSAVDSLQEFPEGIDRLIAEWTSFASIEEWSDDDLARLDRISDAGTCSRAVIRSLIPGEIARLEDAKAAIDPRPIERARQRAADLALFSDSPQAILARKYEAATERAFHKAMTSLPPGRIDRSRPRGRPGPRDRHPVGFVFARAAARGHGPAIPRAGPSSRHPRQPRTPGRPRESARPSQASRGDAPKTALIDR